MINTLLIFWFSMIGGIIVGYLVSKLQIKDTENRKCHGKINLSNSDMATQYINKEICSDRHTTMCATCENNIGSYREESFYKRKYNKE